MILYLRLYSIPSHRVAFHLIIRYTHATSKSRSRRSFTNGLGHEQALRPTAMLNIVKHCPPSFRIQPSFSHHSAIIQPSSHVVSCFCIFINDRTLLTVNWHEISHKKCGSPFVHHGGLCCILRLV